VSARRLRAAAATALVACLLPSATAGAVATRASLPDIERQVMCAECGVPLNIAESQQADRERVFIQGLIDQGQTTAQIKRALVAQYGPRVLATPSHSGFGLAAYLVPIAVAAALLVLLAVLLPRWRRRSPVPATAGRDGQAPSHPLSPGEAARLDADLARFER
jgi:cytochrome c-type biogenesis protein CcmH/NrfF